MLKPDPHGGFRRVVPSPDPYSIVEAPVIRTLIAEGTIVIASGGGGIPVVEEGPRLIGREGVVDKDLAAAILARDVEASTLLILTDVQAVQQGVRHRPGRADRADDGEGGPRRCSRPGSSAPARWARRSRPRSGSSSRVARVR